MTTGSCRSSPNDEPATQRALTEGQWKFRTIELVEASLANRPGSLADVARRLGKAGVNIVAAFPISMAGGNTHVAFATDDPVKAKQTLGELVGSHR